MKGNYEQVYTGTSLLSTPSKLEQLMELLMSRTHNRIINIQDINIDLAKTIKANIRERCNDNLYFTYQQKHKKIELSLYESVEDSYATRDGRYSPEVLVNSL